ncbi:FAD binding domain-containing protein [Rhodofomes roseus]|uniref:FAD binding domain-containing protein n=1 Tax=Rhodofomes roseus TaxID=34475 RepID=A0ABQ8K7D6_9APHY|nr:FAD binding domain-containing protein [Rhodofomes roseus]KAH9832559.1 FAD binding domain-containing protein [Rhodofomes roseus]
MPTALTKESDVDVLIVGAGPAGLMCAMALARAGVNVRIIDQRPAKVAAGQADGIQPRIVEVFQSYGFADRLFKEAVQVHMAAFYNPGPNGGIERTGRAPDVTAPTARWAFEMALHQGGIEQIFLDSMASNGVEVERPMIPTAIQLSQDESVLKDPKSHPVKVVLKDLGAPEGSLDTEVVHAKFLVGCDGAHSWVRRQFGITMEGEQTDYIWGVLDLIPDTDFPDIRNRCAVHSHNGSCMIIPREGDLVRLYVQLADKDVLDAKGRVDKSRVGPETIMEVANKSLYPYKMSTSHPIDWWTLYIIGQRVANQYSVHDRVLIAGDACHTHSPKAGQGMNASMNDTHNLAWKLTHVLRGWADLSILKTYEFERRKYAQDLIMFDKKFAALFSGKPRTDDSDDGVSHEEFLEAFQTFGLFTSGIGVHYQPSAIVDDRHSSYASKLNVGQRLPPQVFIRAADSQPVQIHDLCPSDTRFKVLVFTGDTTNQLQLKNVKALAEEMQKPEHFYERFGHGNSSAVFELLAISSADKMISNYTDAPTFFRSHWSKFLLDDEDMYKRAGGGGYDAYGVDPNGAIVVVRPDGYVGTVAPLGGLEYLDNYFASFMVPSS